MSVTEGKLLTCDVCGSSVFFKYVGDGKYENADGWERYHIPGVQLGDICPKCNERIIAAIAECLMKIKEVK